VAIPSRWLAKREKSARALVRFKKTKTGQGAGQSSQAGNGQVGRGKEVTTKNQRESHVALRPTSSRENGSSQGGSHPPKELKSLGRAKVREEKCAPSFRLSNYPLRRGGTRGTGKPGTAQKRRTSEGYSRSVPQPSGKLRIFDQSEKG